MNRRLQVFVGLRLRAGFRVLWIWEFRLSTNRFHSCRVERECAKLGVLPITTPGTLSRGPDYEYPTTGLHPDIGKPVLTSKRYFLPSKYPVPSNGMIRPDIGKPKTIFGCHGK